MTTKDTNGAVGLVFGGIVGAFFALLVAAMLQPSGVRSYWEIVLPGCTVGLLVGHAPRRWGRSGDVEVVSSLWEGR